MSWRCRMAPHIGQVLTFLNPKDPLCFGVRSWWRKNLPEIQLLNPGLSVSIQELSYGEPQMFVQYCHQDQRMVRIAGVTEDELEEIMEAVVTYGMHHAVVQRPRADDGGDLNIMEHVQNFAYGETFMARLEVQPPMDPGLRIPNATDDPGQRPRTMWPRNNGYKFMP
eukprot:PhM_4_TR7598/c0_g2_i1/m.82618/K03946/NDUFA2; NADH dehydrogenase (ubiquinone) 1 alpha subcomplex subunit 2